MSDVPFAALADVLEPSSSPTPSPPAAAAPVSIREPAQVQDFAFAETVSATELGDESHSTPIFFDDVSERPHCVTPLAFPLPPPADAVSFETRLRVGTAHVRHGFRGALEEMSDLWRGAGEIVESELMEGVRRPPATGLGMFWRRVRALWSCFTWTASDFARAALIGSAVLLVASTAFVSFGSSSNDVAFGASAEVRAGHTVDQHTGHKVVVRGKK